MRKWLIILMTFFILAASGAISAGIYAADADEDLYQNLDEVAQESNDNYFLKYRENYQLDKEKTSFFRNPGSVIFDMFANFVFFLQKMLATITIAFFSFAFTANMSTMLGSYLEPFISAMKSSIWDNLAVYAIGFAAFMLLLKMAQNRTAQALSSLIGIVMIITTAVLFYAYPIDMLTGIDEATTGIANTVMEGPYQAAVGGESEDVKGKANALCWNLFVHMPWQVLEFGSVSTAEKYQDEILMLDPDSDERQKLVDKLAKSDDLFSKSLWYQTKRIGEAVILLIFNLMLMIILLGFSALIIAYQFLLLVYLVLGIFVFLAALIPSFGLPLIRRWAMRIMGICFTRILVVFFLSVVLVFMEVIYKFTDEYGLLTTMFLILVIIFSLWFERYRLLELFSGFQSNASQLPQTMHKSLDTDFNAIDALRKIRTTSFNTESTSDSNNTSGGQGTGASQAGVRSIGQDNIQSAGSGRGFATADPDSTIRASDSMRSSAESILGASQDIGRYFRQAEEVLQRQYDLSKQKSEDTAERTGEKAEYGNFVKRTNGVRGLGAGDFDSRDVSNVANRLKYVDESGGDINDVVADGNSIYWDKQKKVSRPQSVQKVASNIASSQNTESLNNRKIASISGIKFFKDNFGDEMGEEIYENMSQKYGKGVVDSFEVSKQSEGASIEQSKVSYAQLAKQLSQKAEKTKESEKKKESQAVKLRKNEATDAAATKNN